MPAILIADDNEQITSVLEGYAKKEGFSTVVAYNGLTALEEFNKKDFDIVTLDVTMPEIDGFEVCKTIRKISNVPIIMITARGEDFQQIMGLDIGADDYIVKPFSPSEVMQRIKAVLKRMPTSGNELERIYTYDNLVIDLNDYTVSIEGADIILTKREIEVLWTLANNPNQLLTRANLLDIVWGEDYFGDNRTVDFYVKRLNEKLNDFNHSNWDIKTVWGIGFKFSIS